MEWPKIKTILLLILLLTDGFLLALVGVRSWNTSRYQEEAREDALTLLERGGIQMQAQQLPEDLRLPVGTVSRDLEGELAQLVPVLGEGTRESLGGGQYRYTGDNGEAWLRGRGEFSLELKAGAFPLEGELERHAAGVLKRMGVEALAVESRGDGQSGEVTLLQLWEGVPVRSCRVTARYADGGLTSLSGAWLNGKPETAGQLELSAVTGLLRFVEELGETGDVCREIFAMQAAYQLTASLSEPSVLMPIWYLETDTGSYTLDMTTNQLKKL